MKKLGILGGMGPLATQLLYRMIIENTVASKDQEHIDMVILSHATMPDRTKAILTGEKEEFVRAAAKDAKDLEMLGVSNIAIPCNTSHYFMDDIQAATNVPIINMVEESVRYAVEAYPEVKKIGIMGTDGTIQARTYHSACERAGIIPVVPTKERQKDVMSLIYDDIKGGKTGDKEKFTRAYEDLMEQGCDMIILACTELSVFRETAGLTDFYTDALEVLCEKAILNCGKELREMV